MICLLDSSVPQLQTELLVATFSSLNRCLSKQAACLGKVLRCFDKNSWSFLALALRVKRGAKVL